MVFRAMALVALTATSAFGAAPGSSPVGTWFDETKTGGIEISQCGGTLCGKIVWLKEPKLPDGRIKLDIHNDDPSLQKRTICGLPLLSGFVPGRLRAGRLGARPDLQPQGRRATTGRRCGWSRNGTLRVRGFVGVSLFGQTQVWTRPPAALPPCVAQVG